jgi:hypothetical protein
LSVDLSAVEAGGSGASKNFSRMVLSSQLKISLTVNGNLVKSKMQGHLLVANVVACVFRRHLNNIVDQRLHAIVVEAEAD